jgi:hypothetical protein
MKNFILFFALMIIISIILIGCSENPVQSPTVNKEKVCYYDIRQIYTPDSVRLRLIIENNSFTTLDSINGNYSTVGFEIIYNTTETIYINNQSFSGNDTSNIDLMCYRCYSVKIQ